MKSKMEDSERKKEWYDWDWVVVYDGDGGGTGIARTVAGKMRTELDSGTLKKDVDAGKVQAPKIALLKGGFGNFKTQFPHLCDSTPAQPSSTSPMQLNLPVSHRANQGTLPLPTSTAFLGPFTAPTILPSHLTQSHATYNPLRPITNQPPTTPPYASHVALGPQSTSRTAQDLMSDSEDVVRKFRMVEEDEKRRLEMSLRCRSGEEMWSVSDGLEGGVRNRYNNIWPCEYTFLGVELIFFFEPLWIHK